MGLAAKISNELPTTPAVIRTPADKQHVTGPEVVVQGTCQELSPTSIIIVYVDGSLNAGSTVCQNGGTFSVAITPPTGTHTLIARTSNATEDFGPDSNPISVTYTPPVIRGSGSPSSSSCKDPGPLRINSSQPYLNYGRSMPAEWEFSISGGCQPYRTVISWGDTPPISDTLIIRDASPHTVRHGYAELRPSYFVTMTTRSSDGQTARFATVATTSWIPPNGNVSGSIVPVSTPFINTFQGTLIKAYAAYLALLLLVILAWYDARVRRLHIAGRHLFPRPTQPSGGNPR